MNNLSILLCVFVLFNFISMANAANDDLIEIQANDSYQLFYSKKSLTVNADVTSVALVWAYRNIQHQDNVSYYGSIEIVTTSCSAKTLILNKYTLLDKEGNPIITKQISRKLSGNTATKVIETLCLAAKGNKKQDEKAIYQGSGFVINNNGYIVTCNHVVDGKSKITAQIGEESVPLTLVRADKKNDLAVLKSEKKFESFLSFCRGKDIRLGDHCIALGFPLQGILSNEVNITSGQVSAMSGPGNDIRLLQITAPIQPGNSGGPLLNVHGDVCGVIVSKLNALTLAQATGDIPQNIGFALNYQLLKMFLDANGIEYSDRGNDENLTDADIANKYKSSVVLIVVE